MKKLSSIPASGDPRAPQADITNAPHLFGDPEIGDIDTFEEEGDFEDGDADYGDADYGDIDNDPLGVFTQTSGDPASGKFRRGLNKYKVPVVAASAGLTAYAATRAIKKARARAREKAMISRKIAQSTQQQSLKRTAAIRKNIDKLNRNSMMSFFSLKGGKMNSSPIDPLSKFVADMFKNMLDRQNMDTPFFQETAIGTFAAGTWTATATGTVASRFFTGLILQIGTNVLNASPGTVMNITATIPTIQGPLTIAATPFLITYEKGFDVRFLFFPWQLVANKPLPVLGQYNNANPITVQVTGLPAASAVNLVVPGSLHPWTVAMRNALCY